MSRVYRTTLFFHTPGPFQKGSAGAVGYFLLDIFLEIHLLHSTHAYCLGEFILTILQFLLYVLWWVLFICFHCRFFFSADAIEVPLALLHFGTQFGYILTIIALRLTAFTVL